MNFHGRYEHQMDDKGRVSLPSAFRREAEGDRFVLLQWEKPYLTLFPEAEWTSIQSKLREFRKGNPAAWNHVRQISAGAQPVSPDKQGRILVPSWLQADAALEGQVLLIGNIDRVELWNPQTWRDTVEGAQGEGLTRFAHQIFG